MNAKLIISYGRYLCTVLLLALLPSALYAQPKEPAYFDMEIIQPRAGLDKNNRFYRAYPGLVYEVRVAVAGGAYPFTHELVKAPVGMSINKLTGVITWNNPVSQVATYPVSVKVIDSKGAVKTVDWNILVTTEKFMFVDQVNGKVGATGTISDPVKGFADVYGGTAYADKYSTKNQGKFVYFKNGRYSLEGFTSGGPKVQWTNRQPLVFLAYPGQTPIIEMSKVAFSVVDTDANNLYVDGFDIDTIDTPAASENRMGFRIGSLSNNVTFRKNKFHNMSYTEGSYNQSAIMISRDKLGKYWAFQDNEFYDLHGGYGIIGYVAQMVVVEDNYLHDITRGIPIGPKADTAYWFIRNNRLIDVGSNGIWLSGLGAAYGNIEVCNNLVKSNDLALSVNLEQNSALSGISIFRNTFIGRVAYFGMKDGVAGFNQAGHFFDGNVVVNRITNGVICNACNASGLYFMGQNVLETPDSTAVDSQGKLQGVRAKVMGYEASMPTRPSKVDAKLDFTPAP